MNKKIILVIIPLIVLVIASIISFACGPSEPTEFVTHIDEPEGFSIDYPKRLVY